MAGAFQSDAFQSDTFQESAGSYSVCAQAQADVKQTYRAHAQAQSDIKTTYQVFVQSQADIKQVYQAYAQAQATLATRYQAYSQAQTYILTNYQGYGQAQADILQTYQAYAQSQARIKQTYQGYSQAQAQVKQTYQAYAQANARITGIVSVVAQVNARILQTYNAFAQAQCSVSAGSTKVHAQALAYINIIIIVNNFADATVVYDLSNSSGTVYQEMENYDGEATDPSIFYGQFPADGTWRNDFDAVLPGDAQNGWFKFSITQNSIYSFDTFEYASTEHDTVLGLYTGASGPGSWELIDGNDDWDFPTWKYESKITGYLPVGTYYLQVGFYGGTYALPKHVHLHYSLTPLNVGFAQAQAKINAFDVNKHAQAQAFINRSERYAQAAARILATPNFYQRMVVEDGPQAYFPLDDPLPAESTAANTVDDNAYDIVGNYHLLREYGYQGKGPFGQQSTISAGNYSIVTTTSATDYNFLNRYNGTIPFTSWDNPWTIEFWFKHNVDGQGLYDIFYVGDLGQNDTGAIKIRYEGSNQYLSAWIGTGGGGATGLGRTANGSITTGVWYHFVLTRNGTGANNVIGYLNGSSSSWTTFNFGTQLTNQTPSSTIFIGSNTAAFSKSGQYNIDEVALYTTSIDTATIYEHYIYGKLSGFVAPAQAQALINRHFGLAQAQAKLNGFPRRHGLAQAKLNAFNVNKFAQARTRIIYLGQKSAQAQASIAYRRYSFGLANAHITGVTSYPVAQAQAKITSTVKQSFAQAQARISRTLAFAQAQALIKQRFKVAQGQAYIKRNYLLYAQALANIKAASRGYAQVMTFIIAGQRYAQAQAKIKRTDQVVSAQAQAMLGHLAVGQAQAYVYTQSFLVRYNQYILPGYAQTESKSSGIRVDSHTPADALFSEYIGLQNKVLSLTMRVNEQTYLESKLLVQKAGTMLRSSKTWTKLYIGSADRYYLAMTTQVKMEQSAESRFADYDVEFEAKPWLLSDQQYTASGTGLITITRTLDDGGWTPATVTMTGTNITLSGYTSAGDFTGFISVSGTVSNLVVTSQPYTATINGVNKQRHIKNSDYSMFIGPGTTYISVSGASMVEVAYNNRWYL